MGTEIQPANKFGKDNVEHYRDGPAFLKNTTGRLAGKTRKERINISEQCGLQLTAQANLKSVNFLHVTFKLQNGDYRP